MQNHENLKVMNAEWDQLWNKMSIQCGEEGWERREGGRVREEIELGTRQRFAVYKWKIMIIKPITLKN